MREKIVFAFAVGTLILSECNRKAIPVGTNSRYSTKVENSQESINKGYKLGADSLSSALDSNCHISGPVIDQAKDREGFITYRGDVPLYSIEYAPPYSTDSKTIGYVCNMPDKFKRAGLKVKFSGKYYHAYKYIEKKSAGETLLYLYLESIEML